MDPALPEDLSDESSSGNRPLEYHFNPESPRILVVDDEKVIREILSDFLSLEGYLVRAVEDGVEALKELQRRSYNLVISDLKMPNMGGLDLIERITHLQIPVLTVIMTGFGTVETAIEAMKRGRLRLHPQALQGRGGRPHRPARARLAAPAAGEPAPQGRPVHLPDQRGHRDPAVGGEGARPGARRHPRRHRRRRGEPAARGAGEPDPAGAGRGAARTLPRADAQDQLALRSPRAGPLPELPGGDPAVHGRQAAAGPRGQGPPLPGGAAPEAAHLLLLDPPQAQGAHRGHAQRLQLPQGKQVQRRPAQDALRAGQPRRRLHRERPPLREPRLDATRISPRPTSRWRRTSARPSSASPTPSRSPTATPAATPSGWPTTPVSSPSACACPSRRSKTWSSAACSTTSARSGCATTASTSPAS